MDRQSHHVQVEPVLGAERAVVELVLTDPAFQLGLMCLRLRQLPRLDGVVKPAISQRLVQVVHPRLDRPRQLAISDGSP